MQGYDFERSAQRVLKGVREERRWRSHSHNGFFPRTRRFIAIILEFIIALLSQVKCWIDSWRAGPEDVLEHTLKQSIQLVKMNNIEEKAGNPHKLDFYRLLRWCLFHDLPEGDPRYRDINHYTKKKDKKQRAKYKLIEAGILHQQMMDLFGEQYKDYFVLPIERDPEFTEAERMYWEAAELISHCYFMLEGVRLGRVAKSRRERWLHNVRYDLIEKLELNAWKFESVREIVNRELIPKWRELQKNVVGQAEAESMSAEPAGEVPTEVGKEKSSKRAETQNRR